ncbi:hypothetical protein [Maricaulis sp.]|uniref:hypothetical protein n=1 Tax=Maricaulis sp. TaxID=1486257 RepID=UPI0026047140|nr:hypothetical protein [Maricaulis sp.]
MDLSPENWGKDTERQWRLLPPKRQAEFVAAVQSHAKKNYGFFKRNQDRYFAVFKAVTGEVLNADPKNDSFLADTVRSLPLDPGKAQFVSPEDRTNKHLRPILFWLCHYHLSDFAERCLTDFGLPYAPTPNHPDLPRRDANPDSSVFDLKGEISSIHLGIEALKNTLGEGLNRDLFDGAPGFENLLDSPSRDAEADANPSQQSTGSTKNRADQSDQRPIESFLPSFELWDGKQDIIFHLAYLHLAISRRVTQHPNISILPNIGEMVENAEQIHDDVVGWNERFISAFRRELGSFLPLFSDSERLAILNIVAQSQKVNADLGEFFQRLGHLAHSIEPDLFTMLHCEVHLNNAVARIVSNDLEAGRQIKSLSKKWKNFDELRETKNWHLVFESDTDRQAWDSLSSWLGRFELEFPRYLEFLREERKAFLATRRELD